MFDTRELNIAIELWGVAFCAIGVVCALLLIRPKSRQRSLIIAGLVLELVAAGCDALAIAFRGQEGYGAWVIAYAGSAVSFIAYFALLATLTSYLCLRIADAGGPRWGKWALGVWVAAAIMSVLTLAGAHFVIDGQGGYHRAAGYWTIPAYVVAVNGMNTYLALHARNQLGKTALACILFYTLAPIVAAIAQAAFFGIDLVIVATLLGFIVIFLEMQSHTANLLVQQTEDLARAQAEVSDSRIRVMVSQIQPHFMFNTLDTIYGLVGEDTQAAQETVASFSRYLRANLASLNQTKPVPIEREMEHVRTYLGLEHTSDPDRIAYSFDVEATGFAVPALSVQTLAENAVRHGIGAKPHGGTVLVRTRELPGEYTVTIEDDGVGFDPSELPPPEAEKHVGIENTRKRLAALCGGTLDVTSEAGVGTRAIIHIPKGWTSPS